MIISKFKRELNGDVSEIRLNTGEKLQNVEYLTDLEEKTVTENGTYTPSTGKVGFSKVVVNVPATTPTSGTLYAWSNVENDDIPLVYTYTNKPTTSNKAIDGTFSEIEITAVDTTIIHEQLGYKSITLGTFGEYDRLQASDLTI